MIFDFLFKKKEAVNATIGTLKPRFSDPGALPDTRTDEQKKKDYQFIETVASAAPANWVEKDPSQWRKFPIRNQNGSLTCVAQTEAKEMGVMYAVNNGGEFVEFSAGFIYKRRINKSWQNNGGMVGINARDIINKEGTTLESLMPSQNMTDPQVDASEEKQYYRDIAKLFSVPNYVMFTPGKDFETIASTIQTTKKAVMVWFRFDYDEWTDIPFLKAGAAATIYHSVAAVDAVLYKGKKYLVIEDSWGEFYGFKGQRLISEEFFAARNLFASYLINFKMYEKDKAPTPTKQTFGMVLEFIPLDANGEISDPVKHEAQKNQVIQLQEVLKKEGLFPKNIASTGYYGSITAVKVLEFQRKYTIASEAELAALMGRRVGQKTLDKLNELYGGQ